MNHFSTKLTPFLREKMIFDYQGGESVTSIAKKLGISRKCFYYWLHRYETSGREGLFNRSSRPHNSPSKINKEKEQKILALREKEKIGPQRIAYKLSFSASTVYKVLKRHDKNRLYPKQKRKIVRYEKSFPGELVHIDIKHLPQINKGDKEYQFSAVDDYTREAFAMIAKNKSTVSATRFLEEVAKRFSYPIQAVLTDNGLEFSMNYAFNKKGTTKFTKLCKNMGISHKTTKPYRPETNGKVERFHRTVGEELYSLILFQGSKDRTVALKRYLKHYNEQRIHLGIKGLTPKQRHEQFFMTKKCYQCA